MVSLVTRGRARAGEARIVPTPLDLLEELEDMRHIALNRVRIIWLNRVPTEQSEPDVKAAVQCTMGKAAICGYIRNTPQFETPELVAEAIRRSIADPEIRALVVKELRKAEAKLTAASESDTEDDPKLGDY